MATGNFKNVNWLHPQDDGSILYASGSKIFQVDKFGKILPIAEIKSVQSTNSEDGILIWGIWKDTTGNIYAAVFSDKTIRKVDESGKVTTVYTSKGNWSPLHGTFDNKNKLWILETSEKNEVRAVTADIVSANATKNDTNATLIISLVIGSVVLALGILYLKKVAFKKFLSNKTKAAHNVSHRATPSC